MPGRGHAAVALEAATGLYLFDLGEPVGREILARRLPADRLRAAFVSHMHSDHTGGLFQFVKNFHLYHNHPDYLPQVDRFVLALPAEAVDAVKAFFIASYMFPERMNVKVRFLPIRTGPLYADENIRVTAHPTTHFDSVKPFLAEHPEYRGPRGEAFAFAVEAEGKRVVYSGDLGDVTDLFATAKGADLLLLEFGHLIPLEDNLQKLAPLGIRRIVLTHIFPDYNERTAQLQAASDALLPGVVTVADDGLEVVM